MRRRLIEKVERETLEREREEINLAAGVGGEEAEGGLGFAEVTPSSFIFNLIIINSIWMILFSSFLFSTMLLLTFYANTAGLPRRDQPVFLVSCIVCFRRFSTETKKIKNNCLFVKEKQNLMYLLFILTDTF